MAIWVPRPLTRPIERNKENGFDQVHPLDGIVHSSSAEGAAHWHFDKPSGYDDEDDDEEDDEEDDKFNHKYNKYPHPNGGNDEDDKFNHKYNKYPHPNGGNDDKFNHKYNKYPHPKGGKDDDKFNCHDGIQLARGDAIMYNYDGRGRGGFQVFDYNCDDEIQSARGDDNTYKYKDYFGSYKLIHNNVENSMNRVRRSGQFRSGDCSKYYW